MPKHRKDQEISDNSEIDFFRDLGPNSRRIVKLHKERTDFRRTQKKVLDSMQNLKSSDEAYLLALAGIIPIQKIHKLERLIPT